MSSNYLSTLIGLEEVSSNDCDGLLNNRCCDDEVTKITKYQQQVEADKSDVTSGEKLAGWSVPLHRHRDAIRP
jgi:hypothetical protein